MSLPVVLAVFAMFQAGPAGAQQPPRVPPDTDSSALYRTGVATSGMSGLVNIPVAATLPSGSVEFSFTNARTPDSFQLGSWQRNAFINFGFLPWMTVGLRGTVYPDTLAHGIGRDLSENVEIRLLQEHGNTPALAIGGFDALSAVSPYFRTFYAVATKSVGPYLDLTAGVATGPKTLKGPFGGAELKLAPWLSGLGDFDGKKLGAGVRLDPFPATAYRFGVQPRIDIVWRQDVGAAFNVGLRTYMGRRPRTPEPGQRPVEQTRTAAPALAAVAPATGLDAVRHALADAGFENLKAATSTGPDGTTIAVDYENRRYNRDELDALGVVMAIVARHAPTATRMQVTIRRVGLPILTLESSMQAFNDFVDGRRTASEFANQLQISDGRPSTAADATAPVTNRSLWKLDVFAQPIVHTAVLNELSAFQEQSTLSADAWVQLAPGVTLNGRRTIASHTDALFPLGFFDTNTDRLLLHAAAAIPGTSSSGDASAITQISIGRFDHYRVGVADEVNVSLAGGRVSLDGTLGVLGRSTRELNSTVALGGGRVRIAPLDLTASLTAGRFREGDTGATAELSRWFGSSELGFFVTSTDAGRIAGVRFSLPLTPTRELPPWRVRPRLPDEYTQSLHASIKRGDATARTGIGQTLDTDHDIARAFRDRDRLQAVTVLQHVGTIRASALDWISRTQH